MPAHTLRRTRGLELELRSRSRDRRPCAPEGVGATRCEVDPRGRFQVLTERLGSDSAVVHLGGELDVAALPGIEGALQRVRRWGASSVLVDAADIGFVDLTVVGHLAAAHRAFEAAGGGMLVVHPPDCLLRVLDLLDELELPVLR